MASSGMFWTHDSRARSQERAEQARLTWHNWATLLAYVFNLVVTFVGGLTNVVGETSTELSQKYQTLITPARWAFRIWSIIFTLEGLYVVAQLLPRYRNHEAVRISTPWWLAACGCQAAWTVAFAMEEIFIAFILMLGILLSLLGLVLSLDALTPTCKEFVIFRAPFSMHLGWIFAATALNANVLADSMQAEPGRMLGLASSSLACILACESALALTARDPVLCFSVTWALAGVVSELENPVFLNDAGRFNAYQWGPEVIEGFQYAAIFGVALSGGVSKIAGGLRLLSFRRLWTESGKGREENPTESA